MGTWFVTGSSVGLGREIVTAALAAGHAVTGTARNPATLDEFAQRYPGHFLAQPQDVTQAAQAQQAVANTVDRFGAIDVLVCNAGFSGLGSVEEMPQDLIDSQFATNFMGAVHTIRAVLPGMRAGKAGRIILVSSIGARIATPGASFYYASKAALSSLAETLAQEVAPFGIGVSAVEPGAMRTRFAEPTSQRLSDWNAEYDQTVGATAAFMASTDFSDMQQDPAGHAAAILRLAALPDMPTRLLLGADAFQMGTAADAARSASDRQWQELSESCSTPAA